MTATQRIGVLGLLVIAFLLGTNWQLVSAQAEKKAIQKWEYALSDGGNLDKLGEEGWELVTAEPSIPYVQQSGTQHTKRFLILKRPK